MNYTKAHLQTVGSLQGIWGVDNWNAKNLNEDEYSWARKSLTM